MKKALIATGVAALIALASLPLMSDAGSNAPTALQQPTSDLCIGPWCT